ncbi:dihydropteroate synthase [Sulfuriroseicoccus oceanibius]|uniref:Dihydropteroate synthase n=1 Tax=Sulfuriroseicoccus oceanibius TaxID=2707525 RepID=A0A6B3LGC8_9BACT|nr:dihydropteroate synthase [Sulfuriroseicoccus oceanibius]QQL45199.1 dihydropteroate synthase [Sulfuriroseicoccus oceanibius]
MNWSLPSATLDLSPHAPGLIMGILNVTPDSFSDGGAHVGIDAALAHAREMLTAGAGIIDVGGESTRPGAAEVETNEEIARTAPVVAALRAELPSSTLLSIDTRKAAVAEAALAAGADIVNDVSGLTHDPRMLEVCAQSNAGIVIMHMQGSPESMQDAPRYDDVVAEVRAFFQQQLKTCEAAGITADRIVFDPGIGFGKAHEHNLRLLAHLDTLAPANRPILLGVSRKSVIARILGDTDLSKRLWPTVALTSHARRQNVLIHRVHDVQENHHALRMTEAILSAR